MADRGGWQRNAAGAGGDWGQRGIARASRRMATTANQGGHMNAHFNMDHHAAAKAYGVPFGGGMPAGPVESDSDNRKSSRSQGGGNGNGNNSGSGSEKSSTSERRKRKEIKALRRNLTAPKRFKSPYIFFSVAMRDLIKECMPKDTKVTDIVCELATKWRQLPDQEKELWKGVSRRDRARYEAEMADHTGPVQVPNKRPKKPKDAPKRSMSAFLMYSQENRPALRTMYTDMRAPELSRLLAKMWHELPPREKDPYLKREQQERTLYNQRMKAYRARVGNQASTADQGLKEMIAEASRQTALALFGKAPDNAPPSLAPMQAVAQQQAQQAQAQQQAQQQAHAQQMQQAQAQVQAQVQAQANASAVSVKTENANAPDAAKPFGPPNGEGAMFMTGINGEQLKQEPAAQGGAQLLNDDAVAGMDIEGGYESWKSAAFFDDIEDIDGVHDDMDPQQQERFAKLLFSYIGEDILGTELPSIQDLVREQALQLIPIDMSSPTQKPQNVVDFPTLSLADEQQSEAGSTATATTQSTSASASSAASSKIKKKSKREKTNKKRKKESSDGQESSSSDSNSNNSSTGSSSGSTAMSISTTGSASPHGDGIGSNKGEVTQYSHRARTQASLGVAINSFMRNLEQTASSTEEFQRDLSGNDKLNFSPESRTTSSNASNSSNTSSGHSSNGVNNSSSDSDAQSSSNGSNNNGEGRSIADAGLRDTSASGSGGESGGECNSNSSSTGNGYTAGTDEKERDPDESNSSGDASSFGSASPQHEGHAAFDAEEGVSAM